MKGQLHNNASRTRLHFWAQLSTSGLLLPDRFCNFPGNHFIDPITTLEKDSIAMRLSLKTIILALSSGLVQVAAIAVPLPAAFAGNRTYTYTACYFQRGNDLSSVKWQWGLQANNSWYQMNGRWVDTPHTRVKIFESEASQQAIRTSCANSQRYYQLAGYRVIGIYAADRNVGRNYQIHTDNGTQLVSK